MELSELKDALSTSPNDVYLTIRAQDFKVNFVTPNAESILGLSADTIKADIYNLLDLVENLDLVQIRQMLSSLPVGGNTQVLHQHTNPVTGMRQWFRSTIFRLPAHVLFVLSDRTQEMQTQHQLELSLDMLRSANESKSNFLASMSHDIRTPLNAIIGFATLIKSNVSDEALVLEHTQKLLSAGKQLLSIVNDILDMSKIESGNTSVNSAEFSISQLVDDMHDMIGVQAKAKSQEFKVEVRGLQSEYFVGDLTRINQILLNLLSNAVKYTPIGGHITLSISQLGQSYGHISHLNFNVVDDGMGMDAEFVPKIFDPFTREESSTVSKIQGTGLGMSIVKNLVDLMGGIIVVKSARGEGTTVTVNLPLIVSEKAVDNSLWQQAGVKRMLVTCGPGVVGPAVVEALRCAGVELSFAPDLPTMQNLMCEGNDYDMFVIDCELITGKEDELIRRIRDRDGQTARRQKVVLLSYDWQSLEARVRDMPYCAVSPKPFFAVNLERAMQTIMSSSQNEIAEDLGDFSGVRILAAEDNELNAEILTELLKMEGVECDIAENGEVAVHKFYEAPAGHYTAIFMDIQMPVMDGYTASKTIRLSTHPDAKRIPIIAMTANAFEEDIKNALDAGMNLHVAKPIELTVLQSVLAGLTKAKKEGKTP